MDVKVNKIREFDRMKVNSINKINFQRNSRKEQYADLSELLKYLHDELHQACTEKTINDAIDMVLRCMVTLVNNSQLWELKRELLYILETVREVKLHNVTKANLEKVLKGVICKVDDMKESVIL